MKIFNFKKFCENADLERQFLDFLKDGDELSFHAYCDKLEEEGRLEEIDPVFLKWRNIKLNNISQLSVRWLLRRDLPEVMMIDKIGSHNPWNIEEFMTALKDRNIIAKVAEIDEFVVGFIVYSREENEMKILKFVIHPLARKRGIGKLILDKMKSSQYNISVKPDEKSSGFFKKQGFIGKDKMTFIK